MKLAEHLKKDIYNGLYDSVLNKIYCKKEPYDARERYIDLINGFCANFGSDRELSLFSAPGRTEIGGNHTDHQQGCVLAASVNLDVIAAVSLNNENLIRLQSEGYPLDIINLDELEPEISEYNQAKALIRGVVAKFKEMECWLYDVCKEPIDFIKSTSKKREIINKYIPDLKNEIKLLSPKYIIVVKKTCMEKVFAAILESGYSENINAFNTSFPSCSNQNKYVDELTRILRNIL